MNAKWKRYLMMLALILTVSTIGTSVIADDGRGDDDDDERQEYYQETEDDDDDDGGEYWEGPVNQGTTPQQTEYWNIWSREARNNLNNPLPITEPVELPVILEGQKTNIYIIPQEGQLLISTDEIAKILGAQAKSYLQSKIAILQKGDHELAVKAGTNAAFENKMKTPMPTQATFYEKSIYLPISVAANALGYRVSWDNSQKAIVIQSI